jgi:hypothetical protein
MTAHLQEEFSVAHRPGGSWSVRELSGSTAFLSCQQFLKMNGGMNSAETTADNDDSFFARLIG